MRAATRFVVAPFGDQVSGAGQRSECGLVQALVAQSPVEARNERVLDWLATGWM